MPPRPKSLLVLNTPRLLQQYNSNVHRGVHTLSAKATDAYGSADKVGAFVMQPRGRRLSSPAMRLRQLTVAYSWGTSNLQRGDEIILSVMEHHSNLIPWQLLAQRTGAVLVC